jgi:hypothetical protein
MLYSLVGSEQRGKILFLHCTTTVLDEGPSINVCTSPPSLSLDILTTLYLTIILHYLKLAATDIFTTQ